MDMSGGLPRSFKEPSKGNNDRRIEAHKRRHHLDKSTKICASSSKALISNSCHLDSDSDVEEDCRNAERFMNELNAEFQERLCWLTRRGSMSRR
ncbi:hypothetical protein Tco_0917250 [Tanacetum coccineum]